MADRKPPPNTKRSAAGGGGAVPRGAAAAHRGAQAGRSGAVGARQPRPVDDATLAAIFRRFRDADPEPRGELEHVDPYTLLVAVVLSAQATDRSVNLATTALYREASDPAAMVALGEERLDRKSVV